MVNHKLVHTQNTVLLILGGIKSISFKLFPRQLKIWLMFVNCVSVTRSAPLVMEHECWGRSRISLTFLAVRPIFVPMLLRLLDRHPNVHRLYFCFGDDVRVMFHWNVNPNSKRLKVNPLFYQKLMIFLLLMCFARCGEHACYQHECKQHGKYLEQSQKFYDCRYC